MNRRALTLAAFVAVAMIAAPASAQEGACLQPIVLNAGTCPPNTSCSVGGSAACAGGPCLSITEADNAFENVASLCDLSEVFTGKTDLTLSCGTADCISTLTLDNDAATYEIRVDGTDSDKLVIEPTVGGSDLRIMTSVDTDQNSLKAGQIESGLNDSGGVGRLQLYGAGAGNNSGGRVDFYTGADHDTTIDAYRVEANEDDWRIVTTGPGDTVFQILAGGAADSFVIDGGGVVIAGYSAVSGARLGQVLETVTGADSGGAALSTFSAVAANESSILDFNRSRSSTKGTHTIVQDDDILGRLSFRGSNGTSFDSGAVIRAMVDGVPGASNDMPGRLEFRTSPDGAAAVVTRMTIDAAGALTVPNLVSCDTIDTDANGLLSCGTDDGGGGSGDITDVFSCATGDCASITMAATDLLDMSGTDASTATEGLIVPQHATACAGGTAEGQVCWEADANILHIGDGAALQDFPPASAISGDGTLTGTGVLEVTEADALEANGANCSASQAPLGVDASGAAESCTDFEEELNDSAGLLAALSDETGTGVAVFGTSPTIGTPALTLAQGAAPTPTAEGVIEWETDDDHLIVGDGVASVEFVPAEDVSGDATMTDDGVVTVANDSHTHVAANISDQAGGTDITADLEEEAHCSEHDSADVDCSGETIVFAANSVNQDELAATVTFADGDLLDFGTNISSATEGILIPAHATSCASATAEGQICWEEDADNLWIGDGAAAKQMNGGGGLSNVVEDTTPQLGGQLDVNGNALGDGTLELLKFTETGSAVNEVTVANAATGNGPTISASGDDTNIYLNLSGKGTGRTCVGDICLYDGGGTEYMYTGNTFRLVANGGDAIFLSTSSMHLNPWKHGDVIELGDRNDVVTIRHDELAGDLEPHAMTFHAQDARSTATTWLDGADFTIRAGGGASGSAGDADGGDLLLSGGTGYGTGDDGMVVMTTNIGAAPPATCTAGTFYIDTDETDDTNCTTTNDNSLCLCVAADTWVAFENN